MKSVALMAAVLFGESGTPAIEIEYHPDERGARMEMIQHRPTEICGGHVAGVTEKVYNGSTLKLHLGVEAFNEMMQAFADEIAGREGRQDKPIKAHEVGDPFVLSEKYDG